MTERVDLDAVAAAVVEGERAAPCAVVAAAHWSVTAAGTGAGAGVWRVGAGAAGRHWVRPPSSAGDSQQKGQPPPATLESVFDLASLTKPVTALCLARLERAGIARRDQRLGELVPELAESPVADTPLDLLSAHRAGLEAHIEMFVQERGAAQPERPEILRRAAWALRSDCQGAPPPEGFAPVYSDLGYILLGAALEAASGRPLDELVEEQVGKPLGLTLGSLRRLAIDPGRVVPTEEVAWRGGVLRGEIHDENAWILAGRGSAGHAGLFADGGSVSRLGMAILDAWSGRSSDWLSRDDLAPLLRRRPGGSHRAGFDSRSQDGVAMSGRHFGDETFGHLGFTGTSIWMDPERELVGVLLTNRVHPSRQSVAIRRARPRAYDGMFEAMMS